jgi:hypothetical protein
MAKDGIKVTIEEEDRGLGKLIGSLKVLEADKDALYAGVQFPDRRYANGTTVGLVGMAHEFGAPNSTPRTTSKSWLRGTFENNKQKYDKIVREEIASSLDRGKSLSARTIFAVLGPVIKADLRTTIKNLPLIDTRLLLRSVGFRVAKKKK